VLKDTTSRGLCVRVRPPHTIERRGGGEVASKEVGEDLGLNRGFESPDLDRPGRQLHQQGLSEAKLGYQDGSGSYPRRRPRDRGGACLRGAREEVTARSPNFMAQWRHNPGEDGHEIWQSA